MKGKSLALLLLLAFGLAACQTGPQKTVSGQPSDTGLPPASEGGVLTPIEEDIIRAFNYEVDEKWLEASVVYEQLAQQSQQPDRSAYLVKVAQMYYRGELYDQIDPFFERLGEQDILQQDENNKRVVQAGGYLGGGKIYQALLSLPEIDDIVDYEYKALALSIRSRGVLAIGKPLDSARLRMQISDYLRTPEEIEKNHDFIWAALNRITEPSIVRALSEPQTMEVRGWLELNLIARRSNMLPARMEPWIDQWYQRYGEHPAAPLYAVGLLEESRRKSSSSPLKREGSPRGSPSSAGGESSWPDFAMKSCSMTG